MFAPARLASNALVITVAVLSVLASLGALVSLSGPAPSPALSPGAPIISRYNDHRDGNAEAVSNIAHPVLLWSFDTFSTAATSPLVGDLDGDGRPEVVFGEVRSAIPAGPASRHLYALNADGTLKWTAPARYDVSPRALVDLDGDGTVEVIYGEGCHCATGGLYLYVANGADGSLRWSWLNTFWGLGHEGTFASPSLADIDGDGVLDVLIPAMDRYFYALSGVDGSVLWKSAQFSHYMRTSPVMADLDGDGRLEVTGFAESGMVRALDAATGATEWERDYGSIAAATPALGDLDGDGRPEIVFPVIGQPGDPGHTVAVNAEDGSILWDNPTHDFSYRGPALADVDGDGLPDVIDGDSDNAVVVAYRGTDGTILWETPLAGGWASGPVVVADVDGDGALEVLAGSDAGLNVLDLATGAMEWMWSAPRVRGEPWVADLTGDDNAEIIFGAGDGKVYAITERAPAVFEPRTIGYWKHQCTLTEPKGDHVGIQQAFIDAIAAQSSVFAGISSKDEVCRILAGPQGNDMRARAEQQLMALWLNVVSGKVSDYKEISLPGLTTAATVGEAIAEIESTLLDPNALRAELERAKDIADALNNGRGG